MVGRTVEPATPMDARYCRRESGKVSALERRRRVWRIDYSDGFWKQTISMMDENGMVCVGNMMMMMVGCS